MNQKNKSYIKDNEDLIRKIKGIQYIPGNAILVTADTVGLYPSIPHDYGLKSLKIVLDKRTKAKYIECRPYQND